MASRHLRLQNNHVASSIKGQLYNRRVMRITECIVIVDVDGVAGNYRLMEIMKMMMMTTATIMMIK